MQILPGIGTKTAERIFDEVAADPKAIEQLSEVVVPRLARAHWPDLVKLIARLRQDIIACGQVAAVRAWYEVHLRRELDAPDQQIGDLEQLERIAAGYRSRRRFLTDLTLEPPDTRSSGHPNRKDRLILSTIHSAKGLEWSRVHVLNVVDGCIPAQVAANLEEERRLLYVAMTRAKHQLHLIASRCLQYQQFALDDQELYAGVSRFLPRSIHGFFDLRKLK